MTRHPLLGDAATRAIVHVAGRSVGGPLAPGCRVTVHFHPDRAYGDEPLLDAMRRGGRYRSQFETGTTNGGTGTARGERRWRWETRLFGAAYDEAPARERPVYGALDTFGRPHGAAPRFGSSFLRLAAATLSRCTFRYPDSVFEPTAFGVVARCDLPERARRDPVDDPLDTHVEAHLHGPLHLVDDVEALVLDPSFRGTSIAREARRWSCPVEWHPGFRLAPSALERCADYRGPAVAELARRIAGGEALTPASLGRAAGTNRHDPTRLKQLWHCLARFGRRG